MVIKLNHRKNVYRIDHATSPGKKFCDMSSDMQSVCSSEPCLYQYNVSWSLLDYY